ncbi:protein kinase domain-containing protein [Streptomyces sp. 4N509B]|uniref:protein kinase domain-containing protein n=1 Tax=Streptomyces sp. 4N509B TaxID=3457413 RepID=UPI003FD3669F
MVGMRGEVLGGRYRIGELLGEGGMGSVWEALDLRLERPVALKVVGAGLGTGTVGGDPRLAERFQREARLLAKLSSPYIVTVHDFGDDVFDHRPVLYLVMERLAGRSLDQILSRELPPLSDVARWGEQICRALAVAHDAGVVHRDLKPANVMVGPDGLARVLDFGIAAVLAESTDHARLTSTGVVLGTPSYMAPEQIEGTGISARSDLYALGCVLYALATGRPPFRGSLYQLLRQQLEDQAPPPSTLRQGLPPAWDQLISELLAKRPAERPGSATEIAERLGELASRPDRALPSQATAATVVYRPTGMDPRAVLLASCPHPDGGRLPLATGQRMRLEDVLPGVNRFTVGVDWKARKGAGMEVDPSALIVDRAGRVLSDQHFIFYNNTDQGAFGIRMASDEPEARFAVRLDRLEAQPRAWRVLFVLSIHDAEARGHDMAMVRVPHIRLMETDRADAELLCYGFPFGPRGRTALTLGELVRDEDGEGWAFSATSRAYTGGLAEIAETHGVDISPDPAT